MRFASLSPYWFQIIGITGSEKISNDTAQQNKYEVIGVDGFNLVP